MDRRAARAAAAAVRADAAHGRPVGGRHRGRSGRRAGAPRAHPRPGRRRRPALGAAPVRAAGTRPAARVGRRAEPGGAAPARRPAGRGQHGPARDRIGARRARRRAGPHRAPARLGAPGPGAGPLRRRPGGHRQDRAADRRRDGRHGSADAGRRRRRGAHRGRLAVRAGPGGARRPVPAPPHPPRRARRRVPRRDRTGAVGAAVQLGRTGCAPAAVRRHDGTAAPGGGGRGRGAHRRRRARRRRGQPAPAALPGAQHGDRTAADRGGAPARPPGILDEVRRSLLARGNAAVLDLAPLRPRLPRRWPGGTRPPPTRPSWTRSARRPAGCRSPCGAGARSHRPTGPRCSRAGFPSRARRALSAAAVLGSTFDTDEFAGVTGLPDQDAYARAGPGASTGTSCTGPAPATPSGTRCCASRCSTSPPPTRGATPHRRAAATLRRLGRSPARIGHHLVQAGRPADAVPWILDRRRDRGGARRVPGRARHPRHRPLVASATRSARGCSPCGPTCSAPAATSARSTPTARRWQPPPTRPRGCGSAPSSRGPRPTAGTWTPPNSRSPGWSSTAATTTPRCCWPAATSPTSGTTSPPPRRRPPRRTAGSAWAPAGAGGCSA